MANSGLNYIIKVQMEQLSELQKLHDTIVAIQRLSQKGAEFNVRVNEQSLNSLTNDIATSVSKGFSRAGINASGSKAAVTVDTTKLESAIQKLGDIVNNMGRVSSAAAAPMSAGVAAPPGSTGRQLRVSTSTIDARINEIDRAMGELDAYLKKRVDLTAEMVQRIRRSARGVEWNEGEQAMIDRMQERRAKLVSMRGQAVSGSTQSYGSGGTVGLTIDASVLNKAFETGAQRLGDALRRGIDEATAGLSQAIAQAVNRSLAGMAQPGGFRPVTPEEAKKSMAAMGPYISGQQAAAAEATLAEAPGSQSAGAIRKAGQYMGGVASRDAGLIAYAASGGVMALPEQWRQLMTRRVSSTGEVKRIEDQIAELIKRRGQAQDAGNRDAAASIQAGIDEKLLQKNQAIFAQMNAQIASAVKQYQAVLSGRLGRQEITPDEYKRQTSALQFSQERLASLRSSNPNIEREMLLLPDALAQYVRDTLSKYAAQLKRYQQTAQPVDQRLLDEINSSSLLANLAGRRPDDVRQAAGAERRVNQFLGQFGAAKTTYEFIRGRAQLGLPAFNPNLDVDTAPFLDGNQDPGRISREDREKYLRAFLSRGGAFAAQTEERRAYAQKVMEQLYAQQSAGTLGEAGQRRLLEYQREMEFGGRYYYTQSPFARGGLIDNGALLSPTGESARVRAGGARSAVLGNPLGGMAQELSADAKAAQDLYKAMGYVEGALTRVNKTMAEMAKISFDPMIKEFQRLGDAMKPYAEAVAKVRASLPAANSASADAAKIATAQQRQRAIEEERLRGLVERQQVQRLHRGVVRSADMEEVGRFSRSTMPISRDPAELLDAAMRAQRQLAQSEYRQFDLNALVRSQIAAGMDPRAAGRSVNRAQAQYDAMISGLAVNMRALTQQDPMLFGDATGGVRSSAAGVIRTGAARRVVSENLTGLQDLEAQQKTIQMRVKALQEMGSGAPKGQLEKFEKEAQKVQEAIKARYDFLQQRGLLPPDAERSLKSVTERYKELNREFAKQADAFRGVSSGALDAASKTTTLEKATDSVIAKLKSLSAYVFAGGIVYGIASQLRQAASEAVALESDLRRIQGVLPSRSSLQADMIGTGIIQGAMDYGVSARTAAQTGKLFAQTGATPQATIDLTRAALAAQVGAGIEAGQATELLIAVENITDRQVSAQNIIDRISRIESQYAVTAQDLSNAIQRAGSLATQLQPQAIGAVDALDIIIGASTTIIERTRVSGEQAATALRFVLSRLSAPEVAMQLQERFGIQLAGDTPEQLRPLQDILQDISERYNELRASGQTVRAQQLLTTFAGARQSNVGAALLTEFDKVMKVAGESAMAYGDTQARVNLQLDTMQARMTQFNTAFAGFAQTVLSDTGIAGLFKLLLRGGTGILESGQSPGSGFGTGALLLGGGLGARALSGYLGQTAAAQLPRQSLMTGAGLANIGVRGGAAAAAGIGSAAVWTGGILAVVATLAAVGKTIENYFNRRDTRTQDEFDRRQFRESELYQSTQEAARQFAMTPDDFARVVNSAMVSASQTVQQERESGRLPQNQTYNRTMELFRRQLDEDLPSFRSLGTEAQRTAEALVLLQNTIRFTNAIPQQFETSFMKDLNDLFAGYDQNMSRLGAELRKRSGSSDLVGGSGGGLFTFQFFERALRNSAGSLPINISQLRAPGTSGSFWDIALAGRRGGSSELSALDEYARQNLFVGAQERQRLLLLEQQARTRLRLPAGTAVSTEQVVTQIGRSVPAAERDDLTAALGRLTNQRALATQMAAQIQAALGNDRGQRRSALERELGADTGQTAGDLFADAFKQSIEIARQEVEESVRRGFRTASQGAAATAALEALRSNANRVAQNANLAITAISTRDRIMEPIVAYGASMAETSSRERISAQFGMDYDAISARAQAAEQLLVGLDMVPVRILQDMARTGARVVAGGTEGTFFRNVNAPEEGGNVNRAARGAAVTTGDMFTQYVAGQSRAVEQLNAMARQYEMSMREGMSGFIEAGKASPNRTMQAAANQLEQTLNRLAELSQRDAQTTEERVNKLRELTAVEGDFNRQRAEYARIVAPEINDRQRRINELSRLARIESDTRMRNALMGRAADGTTLAVGMRGQALMQADLLRAQLDPRRMVDALNRQLALVTEQSQVRRLDAETTAQAEEQRARATLTNQALNNRLAEIRVELFNQLSTIQSEQLAGQLAIVTQALSAEQMRGREEGRQFVADVTAPIRQLLSNPRNFSREGYEQLFQGIAQAFQNRMVDAFMQSVFGETGLVGGQIIDAFQNGALSTQTAIQEGFRLSLVELEARLRAALSVPIAASPETVTVPIPPANDLLSPAGYGQRVLLTPDGAFALNNKDAVMAGPKLMSRPVDDLLATSGVTQLFPFGYLDPTDPKKRQTADNDAGTMAEVAKALNGVADYFFSASPIVLDPQLQLLMAGMPIGVGTGGRAPYVDGKRRDLLDDIARVTGARGVLTEGNALQQMQNTAKYVNSALGDSLAALSGGGRPRPYGWRTPFPQPGAGMREAGAGAYVPVADLVNVGSPGTASADRRTFIHEMGHRRMFNTFAGLYSLAKMSMQDNRAQGYAGTNVFEAYADTFKNAFLLLDQARKQQDLNPSSPGWRPRLERQLAALEKRTPGVSAMFWTMLNDEPLYARHPLRGAQPVNDVAMGPGNGRVITGPEGAFQLNPKDQVLAGTDIFRNLNEQIQQLQMLAMSFSQLSQVLGDQNLADLAVRLDTQTAQLGATAGAAAASRAGAASGPSLRNPNWRAVYEKGLPLVGSYVGANMGGRDTYAAEGSQILSGIGTLVGGPVGGLVGGIIGGFFGGRIGKKQPEPEKQFAALQNIERNTAKQIEAVENQTKMLTLDSRFLNVPTGFAVPGYRPFGSATASMSNEVTINVYASQGQSEQAVAQQVAAALQTQLRGFGTSYDLRN